MLGLPSCQIDGRVLVLGDSLPTFAQMLPILEHAGVQVAKATATDLCGNTANLASFDLGLLVCSGRESQDRLLFQRIVRAKLRCIVVLRGSATVVSVRPGSSAEPTIALASRATPKKCSRACACACDIGQNAQQTDRGAQASWCSFLASNAWRDTAVRWL
jgi:hypothetical protein